MNKEEKQKQRRVQSVVNKFLDVGVVAGDFLNLDKYSSCVSAYESYMKDQAFKEYREWEVGEDFTYKGLRISHDDMIAYCESVDTPPDERYIPVARRMSMSDIEQWVQIKYESRWSELYYDEKLKTLYELGFAVLGGDKDNESVLSKYYVERTTHRNLSGKIVDGLVVVGSERGDKEWLNSGCASYEAKIYSDDPEMIRDLSKMGRY